MVINSFIVFDTENDPVSGQCYMVGVYDKDGYHSFTDCFDALRYMIVRPERYIFAFNLSYDAFNLLGSNLFNCRPFFIKGRLAKLTIGKKSIMDVYNHWHLSIKEAGEMIGIKKQEHQDYKIKVSKEYNYFDCKISYDFIKKMIGIYQHRDIKIKLTLAGTALTKMLESGIRPDISQFQDWYYSAYFGGRTEVFKLGGDQVNSYDINGMYPFCMLNNFPYPLKVIPRPDLNNEGLTKCLVRSDMAISILPYRNEARQVFFPSGTFTGTWCNNELNYFLANGGQIIKVLDGIHFRGMDKIFQGFINTWYGERLKSKTPFESYFWKKFLNASYGKYGEKAITQKILYHSEIKELAEDFIPVYGGEYFIINEAAPRKYYANVIWAAYTTAFSRIKLHEGLIAAGHDRIVYCDTDSIYTDGELPDNLIDPKKLGFFKNEGQGKMIIYAPKDYDFNDIKKRKGIPLSRAIEDLKNPGTYFYEKPIKLFEGLKRGIQPNTWINMRKENKREIKNKVRRGNNFYPIMLNNP
jgi:hypothetical protein